MQSSITHSNTERNNKILDTAFGKLVGAVDGNRNAALNEAAYTLGGLIGAGSLPPSKATEMLLDTALAIGLSEAEAIATIKSGLDGGMRAPFTASGQRILSEPGQPAIAEIDKGKAALKKAALRDLAQRRPDLAYHSNLNGRAEYVRDRWGISDETIANFRVGYCQSCPQSPYSDSYTLPYYWHGKLVNLRHRLNNPNGNGKYRPEAKDLPTAIFNANYIEQSAGDWIILVEGEFKTMVLCQEGLATIGIPGASNIKLITKCIPLFAEIGLVYIVLDPGAEEQALKIGKQFKAAKIESRLVTLPTKPDDFFTLYGGTVDQFKRYLETGRAI